MIAFITAVRSTVRGTVVAVVVFLLEGLDDPEEREQPDEHDLDPQEPVVEPAQTLPRGDAADTEDHQGRYRAVPVVDRRAL